MKKLGNPWSNQGKQRKRDKRVGASKRDISIHAASPFAANCTINTNMLAFKNMTVNKVPGHV
jgi:hypothetical protein